MIPMISKKSHRFGGKRLVAGDPFEVRGRTQARLLTAIGVAEPGHPPVRRLHIEPYRPYVSKSATGAAETPTAAGTDQAPDPERDLRSGDPLAMAAVEKPAAPSGPAAEPAVVKPKRHYARKDLTAEG